MDHGQLKLSAGSGCRRKAVEVAVGVGPAATADSLHHLWIVAALGGWEVAVVKRQATKEARTMRQPKCKIFFSEDRRFCGRGAWRKYALISIYMVSEDQVELFFFTDSENEALHSFHLVWLQQKLVFLKQPCVMSSRWRMEKILKKGFFFHP